jgi:hypothetical protein
MEVLRVVGRVRSHTWIRTAQRRGAGSRRGGRSRRARLTAATGHGGDVTEQVLLAGGGEPIEDRGDRDPAVDRTIGALVDADQLPRHREARGPRGAGLRVRRVTDARRPVLPTAHRTHRELQAVGTRVLQDHERLAGNEVVPRRRQPAPPMRAVDRVLPGRLGEPDQREVELCNGTHREQPPRRQRSHPAGALRPSRVERIVELDAPGAVDSEQLGDMGIGQDDIGGDQHAGADAAPARWSVAQLDPADPSLGARHLGAPLGSAGESHAGQDQRLERRRRRVVRRQRQLVGEPAQRGVGRVLAQGAGQQIVEPRLAARPADELERNRLHRAASDLALEALAELELHHGVEAAPGREGLDQSVSKPLDLLPFEIECHAPRPWRAPRVTRRGEQVEPSPGGYARAIQPPASTRSPS